MENQSLNQPSLSVSVIIAAYNAGPYLAEAIASVLAQTYQPAEVIVVDDGSTDETAEVAASFAGKADGLVRLDRQPHRGVAATLNRGIELAQGDLFAILDADDLWLPDKLQKQIEILQARPEVDCVFCHAENFLSPELATTQLRAVDEPIPAYNKGTLLIRREAFWRVGYFDPAWQVGDFIDWYAKAVEAGIKSWMLPEVLYRRRIHGQNMTVRERPKQADYVRILKAALDRRRQQASNSNSKPNSIE